MTRAMFVAILAITFTLGATSRLAADTTSEPRKLTTVRYAYADLSPSGHQFVVEANVHGNWELYLLDRDGMGDGGEGLTPLTRTDNTLERMPAWSPDGRFIAFISDRDGNFDLYRMNADGSNVIQLTETAEPEIHPFWGPDSKTIIYNRRVPGDALIYSIWTTDPDGKEHVEILRDEELNSYAQISPDGRWIVFDKWWENSDENGEIFVMNRASGELRRLTSNDVYDGYPTWFPDSHRILYSSQVDGAFKLFATDIDGSAPIQLTFGPGEDQRARVTPDGKAIYFNRNLNNTIELYEMAIRDLSGSDP